MAKEEREKGFLEQIKDVVVPLVVIIIIIIFAYVLQAVVNILNFLSENPWVAVVVACAVGFLVFVYILAKMRAFGRFKMDSEFLKLLPPEVQERLNEAQGTYQDGYYRSCSVMMRGTLETAIEIRFNRAGKEEAIRGKSLPQKIELSKQEGFVTPSIARKLNQLVKWIGDIGAHDYKVKIRKEDVETSFQTLRIALEHMYH